jgi:cytochrome P450
MSATEIGGAPASQIELWAPDALADPYPLYRELRDAGPVVWLQQYDLFVLARYADVRAALENWPVFSSAQGVMMNQKMNDLLRGIVLCTDPPEHTALRGVLKRPLEHEQLKALEPEIDTEAQRLVDRLVEQRTFDAATELAPHLPLEIVSKRVGLPEEGRERMLDWAFANFQCFGPMNALTEEAFATIHEAVEFSTDPTLRERLTPGGWAAQLYEAEEAGELPAGRAAIMLNDYWGPSLDTTIFGVVNAIWLFAQHPDQWELLREEPSLLPHAVNEALRLESPLQAFSRKTTEDHEVDGISVPAGSRVVVVYASANRDERKYEDPERFDITRKPNDQLAFGWGPHQCVGMPLARLEMRALLKALVQRVERFELGETERAVNNVLRGFRRLEVTVA